MSKTAREKMEEWINEPPPREFKGPRLVVKDGQIVCGSVYVKVNKGDRNWSERRDGGIWLSRGRRVW